jgi:hypothetical protein
MPTIPRLVAPASEIAETIHQLRSIVRLRAEHPSIVTYQCRVAAEVAISIIEAHRDQLLSHPAAAPAPARGAHSSAPTKQKGTRKRKSTPANGNAFTRYALPADVERVRDALRHVLADDRKTWLDIGMALKHEFGDGGRELFDEWSTTSQEYDRPDQEKTWQSLGKRDGIGIGTLFHYAREGGWTGDADDARIAALAALNEVAYQKRRGAAAKEIGVGVGVLDKMVRRARAKAEEEAEELPHWAVEPWADPVDTGALLADLEAVFRKFIFMPKGAAEALALWTLHAWTMDAGDISPFMVMVSPTRRCGKTSVLILLYYLTPRSELASNISPSALFRYVEQARPTLLLDEGDTFLTDSEETRGILNSGHTRAAAHVIRNVEINGQHKPRRFSTWAPKAIATIQKLADTLADRSIVVSLQRKPKTVAVTRLRTRDSGGFEVLRRRAARWAADNFDRLADPDPAVPDALNDRAADNWRPLLAIADLAGDAWSKRAREAACTLSGAGHDSAINVELLVDVRQAFDELDVIRSADLIERLTADPERPWAEWKRGRALTQKQLANLLRPFGVTSVTVGPLDGRPTAKGYKRTDFEAVWAAYLPGQNTSSPPEPDFETSKRQNDGGSKATSDFRNVKEGGFDGSKNADLSYSHVRSDASTDRKPESGVRGHNGQDKTAYRDRYQDRPADAEMRRASGKDRLCALCGEPEGPGDSLWPAVDDDNKPVLLHAICLARWAGDNRKRRRAQDRGETGR